MDAQLIDRRKKEIHTYCMYQDEARCVQFVIFSDISLRPFFLAVPWCSSVTSWWWHGTYERSCCLSTLEHDPLLILWSRSSPLSSLSFLYWTFSELPLWWRQPFFSLALHFLPHPMIRRNHPTLRHRNRYRSSYNGRHYPNRPCLKSLSTISAAIYRIHTRLQVPVFLKVPRSINQCNVECGCGCFSFFPANILKKI